MDDDITDYENGLALRLRALRDSPSGLLDDPAAAAEIVSHLSIRNDNVRGSMTHGFRLIMRRAFGFFGEEDGLSRRLGLDSKEPSQRFKDRLVRPILEHPGFRETGLPEAVITRVAFGLAREHLPGVLERHGPVLRAALAHLHEKADSFVRTSHNKALAENIVPDARAAALA